MHAAGCDKQRFTDASPSVQYTVRSSVTIFAYMSSSSHRSIASYLSRITICA